MDLDYTFSGIKTLRFASVLFLIAGVVCAGLFIPLWDNSPEMIAISVMILIFSIFSFGLGFAVASIAENTLYLKEIKEKEILRKQ